MRMLRGSDGWAGTNTTMRMSSRVNGRGNVSFLRGCFGGICRGCICLTLFFLMSHVSGVLRSGAQVIRL